MSFGEKLKELRKERKLTVRELAEKSGVSFNSISKYENDQRTPSINAAKDLANALNSNIKYFINDLKYERDKNFINYLLEKNNLEHVFSMSNINILSFEQLKNIEYDIVLFLNFLIQKYNLKE